MKAIHILAGSPAEFAKSVNKLIASRDVALSLKSISASPEGKLAGVVEELPRATGAPGSLVEVSASIATCASHESRIGKLAAENPCWSVEGVFPVVGKAKGDGEEKSKAAPQVLLVAVLSQP